MCGTCRGLLFEPFHVHRCVYALAFCVAGGVVTAGLAIYDTMQYILNPISTWCVGQAASMGSLLLAAGTKGMRHSLPNARIMVHQPSGGARVRMQEGKGREGGGGILETRVCSCSYEESVSPHWTLWFELF